MQKQRSGSWKKVLPVSDGIRTTLLLVFFICTYASVYSQHKDNFDWRILDRAASHRTERKTRFFKFISKWNNPVCLAMPASLFIAGAIRNDTYMKKSSLYVTESVFLSQLVNVGLKKLFNRKRPCQFDIHFNAVYCPKNESFPSGHTAEGFSMATSMSLAYPKWYVIAPTYAWASLVGYSRVYLGVHYPSDVITGAIVSSGVTYGLWKANKSLRKF